MARYARMLILFVAGVFAVGMLPQANAQVVVRIGHRRHYHHHYYYRHGHRYYR